MRRFPGKSPGWRRPQAHSFRARLLNSLLFIIGYTAVWVAFTQFLPHRPYLPSAGNIALLMLGILLTLQVRLALARYTFMFWFGWYIIGSVSIAANNFLYWSSLYFFDPSRANSFYLLCLIAGVCGALLIEAFTPRGKLLDRPVKPVVGPIGEIWLVLLIFPFLYAASIIWVSGDIPIISGRDVSASMYKADYGPLIAFGIYIPVVCLMVGMTLLNRRSWVARVPFVFATAALLIMFLLMAGFDGRRVFTLIALAGLLLYYISTSTGRGRLFWTAGMGAASLAAYVMAAALRSGSDASSLFRNALVPFTLVGVEYRDFAYGYLHYSPQLVRGVGYDWTGSTLAASIPSFLLTPLGIDKGRAVLHDSARTMMHLRGGDLGIRIGLPGELWFAFGWAGILVFLFFGMLVYATAKWASRARNVACKAILLVQVAIFMLAVNGQSTVTFGLALPLIYLAIAIPVVERALRGNARGRRLAVPHSRRGAGRPIAGRAR